MQRLFVFLVLCISLCCSAWAAPLTVQIEDFETTSHIKLGGDQVQPKSTLQLQADQPFEGKQCAVVHYRFEALNNTKPQYVQISTDQKITTPLKRVTVAVRGDGSGAPISLRVNDVSGETFQFGMGRANFTGWKVLGVNMDANSFHFGGDGNGKMDAPLTVQCIIIDAPAKPSEGDIAFDDLCVDTEGTAEDFVNASITCANPTGYFWGKTAPTVNGKVTVTGRTRTPLTLPMTVRLLNYQEEPVKSLSNGTIEVQANRPVEKTFSIVPPKFGVYFVEVTVGSSTQRTSFSWLPSPAPTWASSPFGIGTHFMNRIADPVERLTIVKNMGASWMRDDFIWKNTEKMKGIYTMPEHYDHYIKDAIKMGLNPFLIFCYGNPNYDGGKPPTSPEGLQAYAKYCQQLVKHYGNDLKVWDMWNEPNLSYMMNENPGATPYVQLMKAAYPAIKAVNPNIRVSCGAIAGMDFAYIEDILRQGGGQYMDILSIHPYRYPISPEVSDYNKDIERLQQLLHQYKADHIKIWITEMGYPTHIGLTGVREATSAAYIVREYLQSLIYTNIERIMMYDFQDDGTNPSYNEHHFGAIHNDLTPKVTFGAYNTMVRMVADKRFVKAYNIGADLYCYEFAGKGGNVLAIWAKQGTTNLSIQGKEIGKVTCTDLMGNTEVLGSIKGTYPLAVTEEPVFLANLTAVKPAKAMVSLTGTLRGWPGEQSVVTLSTADKSLAGKAWRMETPEGWTVKTLSPVQFAITPSGTATLGAHTIYVRNGNLKAAFQWVLADPIISVTQRKAPQTLQVEVTNPYAQSRELTLQPQSPGKTLPQVKVTMAPGATRQLDMNIPTEDATGWTNFPIDMHVTWNTPGTTQATTSADTHQIIYGFTPCYQLGNITLDGDLTEWQGLKPCVVPVQNAGKDTPDLDARFWTGYDASGWYIALNVVDDKFTPAETAANSWRADGVQFAFAVGDTRYEFGFSMDAKGNPLKYQWTQDGKVPEEITLNARHNGTTTCYEARIPWKTLGVTSFTQRQICFALLMNDEDGKGRKMVEWFPGIGSSKEPQRYSTLFSMPTKP
ncbi:MAG TPA: sugar-binding protein [Armatimonadota bacterium]|nr:sugar-binding protein [Armatimonadota bacterium]